MYKNCLQQCIKIIAEIAVNSRVVARFNFLVTCQESATQPATILILNVMLHEMRKYIYILLIPIIFFSCEQSKVIDNTEEDINNWEEKKTSSA